MKVSHVSGLENVPGKHPWQGQKPDGGNGRMQDEDCRQTGAKRFLAGLVAQQPLGGERAETAAEEGKAQKLVFGNTPCATARRRLVPPEDAETSRC